MRRVAQPAPCVLYARASSDRQDHAAQLSLVRGCVASCGDTLRAEYSEKESASGKAARSEWQRMLADLRKRGAPRRIHAYQLDRLTRNFADQLALAELVRAGVEVHLCRPNRWWTPDTDYDEEFGLDIETALAKRFTANLRAETIKGMRHAAESGRWPGHAPFGYRNVREGGRPMIVPHEEHAALVRRCFALAAAGESVAEIARMVKAEGYRGRIGKRPIAPTSVSRLLRQRAYLGEVTFGLPAGSPGHPGQHAPLVTPEEWQAAHHALGWIRRTVGRKRKGEEPDVWFRGLFACGCGATMTPSGPHAGRHGRGTYVYARCAKRCGEKPVRQERLAVMVADALRQLALDGQALSTLRAAVVAAAGQAAAMRAEREKRLQAQRRRALEGLETLHADRCAGTIRPEVYDRRAASLGAELDDATAGLAGLDVASAENRTLAIQVLDSAASLAASMLSASVPATRRALVVAALSNPAIRGGQLVTEFAQPFDLLALAASRRGGGDVDARPESALDRGIGGRGSPTADPCQPLGLAWLSAVASRADALRGLLAA